MKIDITPAHLYKMSRMSSASGNYLDLGENQAEEIRTLFYETDKSLLELFSYVSDKYPKTFGAIYTELKMGKRNLEEILSNTPDIIIDALDQYKLDKEEETYLAILEKTTAEMTGYELSVLLKYTLKENRKIFSPKR